jgi:ATP-binding cassette subfamily B protein
MNKKKNKGLLKFLFKYAKQYILGLIVSFILALCFVVATLISPVFIGKAIDLFSSKPDFKMSNLNNLIYMLIIICSIGFIFGFLMNYMLNRITYKVIFDLRKDAFKKILNVPVKYLDSHLEGDVMQRIINDTDQVADGLLQGFTQFTTGILTILITIGLMLYMNWILGLLVIVLTPLSIFVAKFISSHTFKTFKIQTDIKGEMSGFENEMITNQKIVLSYGMTEENIKKFNELDAKLYKAGIDAQFYSSLTNPSTRFVNNIVYAIVATIGAIMIIYNKPNELFGVGQLSAFLTYANQYTKPFNDVSSVATELTNSFASLKRVYDLIMETQILDSNKKLELNDCNIQINNVSFGYNDSRLILKDINVEIEHGKHYAIVGPTGCGKTTLINLLMHFYDVTSGEILIDNQNILDFSRESLRENIGMVLQETWLFKGTVFENVAYAKKGASKEEVIEACKKAYADDFIMHLPNGYDTVISDDDSVSLGQKQLICIARLMLRNPNILILDEATSNIDTRTEIMVQKAFDKLMEGHTSIIIAHRLQTIKEADKILVMKDGNLIESGSHNELLNKNGFYKELYYSQFEH